MVLTTVGVGLAELSGNPVDHLQIRPHLQCAAGAQNQLKRALDDGMPCLGAKEKL